MAANFIAMKYLSKVLKNLSCTKIYVHPNLPKTVSSPPAAFTYSTIVPKQFFSMLDIFIDMFYVKPSTNSIHLEPINVLECPKKSLTDVHKIDKLIGTMDISNMQSTVKILIKELQADINVKDWNGVDRILVFFVEKKLDLNNSTISSLAKEFCNAGFLAGLKSLLSLVNVTKDDPTIRGEVLYNLAVCNWRIGNVRECLMILSDSCENHAENNDSMKKLLRIIIHRSVSSHSEAVLLNVVKFVKEFAEKHDDSYLITALWNDLFMSEWYSDQQLADSLLHEYEHLRTGVTMMASTLARNFIRSNKFGDVYRLLEVLLKHKITQPYAAVTQMLYDHYCLKGDKFRCSEIIKSSIRLQIPLREEQYNSFISWSVSGNPYKFIKPVERNRSTSLAGYVPP